MLDLDLFKRAGIKPVHLVRLLQVSRVSASRWFNGHSEPSPLVLRMLTKLNAALEAALAAGDLPVHSGIPRDEVNGKILSVVRGHLRSLGK